MAKTDIVKFIEQSGVRRMRFGGFVEEDVYAAMERLCAEYDQRQARIEAELRRIQQDNAALEQHCRTLANQNRALSGQNATLAGSSERFSRQSQELDTQLSSLRERNHSLSDQCAVLKLKNNDLTHENASLRERAEQAEAALRIRGRALESERADLAASRQQKLDEASAEGAALISQARRQADALLDQARLKADAIEHTAREQAQRQAQNLVDAAAAEANEIQNAHQLRLNGLANELRRLETRRDEMIAYLSRVGAELLRAGTNAREQDPAANPAPAEPEEIPLTLERTPTPAAELDLSPRTIDEALHRLQGEDLPGEADALPPELRPAAPAEPARPAPAPSAAKSPSAPRAEDAVFASPLPASPAAGEAARPLGGDDASPVPDLPDVPEEKTPVGRDSARRRAFTLLHSEAAPIGEPAQRPAAPDEAEASWRGVHTYEVDPQGRPRAAYRGAATRYARPDHAAPARGYGSAVEDAAPSIADAPPEPPAAPEPDDAWLFPRSDPDKVPEKTEDAWPAEAGTDVGTADPGSGWPAEPEIPAPPAGREEPTAPDPLDPNLQTGPALTQVPGAIFSSPIVRRPEAASWQEAPPKPGPHTPVLPVLDDLDDPSAPTAALPPLAGAPRAERRAAARTAPPEPDPAEGAYPAADEDVRIYPPAPPPASSVPTGDPDAGAMPANRVPWRQREKAVRAVRALRRMLYSR